MRWLLLMHVTHWAGETWRNTATRNAAVSGGMCQCGRIDENVASYQH